MKKIEQLIVENFLNPDIIYIPYNDKKNLRVKSGDKINKYDKLLETPKIIYSPISGIVTNISKKYIEIANDFKEFSKKKIAYKKDINNLSKKDVIDLINNLSYIKLNGEYNNLIVSFIDKDKFDISSKCIANNFINKILDTIDLLSQKLEIPNIYLAVKTKDDDIVMCINNNIGTYPNIKMKMVNDIYAIGFKEVLIPKVIGTDEKNDCLFLECQDLLAINDALYKNKPTIERYITVMNKTTNEVHLYNIKIGTKIEEIKKNLNISEECAVINGLICGIDKTSDDIIDYKTKSLFFALEDTTKPKKCINCGLCKKMCPKGLNPRYIMTHKKASKSDCIHCGTCSFICPSRINFKVYLGDDYE